MEYKVTSSIAKEDLSSDAGNGLRADYFAVLEADDVHFIGIKRATPDLADRIDLPPDKVQAVVAGDAWEFTGYCKTPSIIGFYAFTHVETDFERLAQIFSEVVGRGGGFCIGPRDHFEEAKNLFGALQASGEVEKAVDRRVARDAAVETLLAAGWTQELIEARSSVPVEITPAMEDALRETWKTATVRSESLEMCRGAYYVSRKGEALGPPWTAINNVDGYGYREVFTTLDEALRFLRDSQLDVGDPDHPLRGIDRDASYMKLERDKEGKIIGYEMVYWDEDAAGGLGAFCIVNGEPADELVALCEDPSFMMPAQYDRREYWVDFGTFDFYQWVDELKSAYVNDDPSNRSGFSWWDYIGTNAGGYLFEKYVGELKPDILNSRHSYGYAHLDENHIVRAGDARSPVLQKELVSDGIVWFTSDEEAVACYRSADGKLSWASDNCHAIGSLMDEYERIAQDEAAQPDFISEKGLLNLRTYAADMGISLDAAIREAQSASTDIGDLRDADKPKQQSKDQER